MAAEPLPESTGRTPDPFRTIETAGLLAGDLGDEGDRASQTASEQTRGAISRSAVLVGSRILTWGLAFVMTVMMPRYLGATSYGRLYLAMSLTGIMSILVEFGLNSLVAREVSKHPSDATRYLINAGMLKAALWVVGCGVLAAVVRIIDYPEETQLAVAILAVMVLITCEGTLVAAVLQANDRMRWIAYSTAAEKLVYVVLGVVALVSGHGILVISAVALFSAVVSLSMNLIWFRRMARSVEVSGGWRGVEVPGLFVRALPFFSVAFFGAIYFRADVIIMSLFKSDAIVGYYGAAYRLFQTTYVVPDALLFALFPLFCRLSAQHENALAVAAQKGLDLLLLLGFPLAAGVFVLSDEIVYTLYGADYADSVVLLRILAVAIALMYANGVFVQLLVATERQKRLAFTAGVSAVLNVSANFVLIPFIGAVGAALATVMTELIVIVMNFSYLDRGLTRQLRFGTPARALAAALLMAAVLMALGGKSLLLLIPVGVGVYAAGIVLFRALPPDDRAMMKAALENMRKS